MKQTKKIILIMLLIVSILLGIILTSVVLATDRYNINDINEWQVDDRVLITPRPDTTNAIAYMNTSNLFCFQKDQDYASDGASFNKNAHTIVGKIQILGENIESATIRIDSNTVLSKDNNLSIANDDNAKRANLIMSQIITNIEKYPLNDEGDSGGADTWKDGNGVWHMWRDRKTEDGYITSHYDVFQWIMWNYSVEWGNTIFPSLKQSDKSAVNGYIQYNGNVSDDDEYNGKALEEISNYKTEINNMPYTTSDAMIEDHTDDKVKQKVIMKEENGYTTLGPFIYSYSKYIREFNVYFNDNKDMVPSSKKMLKYQGDSLVEFYSNLVFPQDKEFYIQIPTNDLNGKDKINIDVSVEGIAKKLSTIYLLSDNQNNYQKFGFIATDGDEMYDTKKASFEYPLTTTKTVSVQKQDTSGNTLNTAGITFYVYDESGTYKGTLTTTSNGKTNELKLDANKTYTLKEISNSLYGYKNATIKSATMTTGTGTISVSNGEVKFTLTGNSTIYIPNTPELINLTINKKGENNTNLQGVKFLIAQNNSYLRLIKTNGSFEQEITGSVTINSENKVKTGEYRVTFTEDSKQATKFVTNSSGKIEVKNLEKYSGKNTKYIYHIYEIENNNYGYTNMNITDVTVTGADKKELMKDARHIKIDQINSNIVATIKNTQELGNIAIKKLGENDTPLENVEFLVYNGSKYLQLIASGGKVVSDVKGEVTINKNNVASGKEYKANYVANREQATIFKTDKSGSIKINNVEIYSGKGTKYYYYFIEISNNNYGYLNMEMSDSLVTVTGATKKDVNTTSRTIKITDITSKTTITIRNKIELGNIEITKVDKDDKSIVLQNVKFRVTVNKNKYLQLLDNKGTKVEEITGKATININNIANQTEYAVNYVDDVDDATIFITDSKGKITINNLEIYSGKGTKNSYAFQEIENSNYGYNVYSSNIENSGFGLTTGETKQIQATNEKSLGDIAIKKVDELTNNPLANIEFVLSTDKEPNTYIALYRNGKLFDSVTGEVTINEKNIADEQYYEVKYVKLDRPYLELTDAEKSNAGITIFKTNTDGRIRVNNLEVNNNTQKVKYNYRLTETHNPYYGYEEIDVTKPKYYETELTKNQVTSLNYTMTNKQEKTKISGYVWLEKPNGKSNTYDGIYTEDTDIRLTGLYTTNKDGILILNENYLVEGKTAKVEIKLRNKTTGQFVKQMPDEFYQDGKYVFNDVQISELSNYEVVFVYNGFYYTTLVEQLDLDVGSKVKELSHDRATLNSKFANVKDNQEVVATDGTINKVEYIKQGHISTVSGFKFDTNISATTTNAQFNLYEKFIEQSKNSATPTQGLDNINMGIVLREQPKISLGSDINGVVVEFEGHSYTYRYKGRQANYENKEGIDVGVKFEQENLTSRYTRTVYTSDIKEAQNNNKDITVSITYAISISNRSTTLSMNPEKIINYFDRRYTIKAIGRTLNEETMEITDMLDHTEQAVEGNDEYKSTIITFNTTLAAGKNEKIYITFDVDRDAILGLLNGKSTYHNATEVFSYSSTYAENTGKDNNGNSYITENSSAGSTYAGIDIESQPGNIKLVLVDYEGDPEGTQVLDNTEFEDDTTSSPSLILEASKEIDGVRQISGSIWEDTNIMSNREKLGDGIQDDNENKIADVQVSLHKVDSEGNIEASPAKYSNGEEATTLTNQNGEYTFGYYDAEDDEYAGILPGRYVIKYTYDGETYIVTPSGNKNVNVMDYKSTIVTSNIIKNAIEKQDTVIMYNGTAYTTERWYLIDENGIRYNDAIDNIELRKDMVDGALVKNSTYKDQLSIDSMDAYTPILDVGIEYTPEDSADAIYVDENGNIQMTQFSTEIHDVDFGIIQRPEINITVDKKITGLQVSAQNGTNIIPKGDPSSDSKMPYVKTGLDGLVSAEIETGLLQGAKLNLEFTITVTNDCDIDYLEKEYYYYGRGGVTQRHAFVTKLVDYLDDTMQLDPNNADNNGIWEVSTVENLKDNGFIDSNVLNDLQSGKYTVLLTEEFNNLQTGEEKSVKLYTSRYLGVSEDITEKNATEIIELAGGRTIKESIPGNYEPSKAPTEKDSSKVTFLITPPTGLTVDYKPYILATTVTFIVLLLGIVVIKKKIVK